MLFDLTLYDLSNKVKERKIKKEIFFIYIIIIINHDNPFGGKLDCCFPPSEVRRTNCIIPRFSHSPFHIAKLFITSPSVRSGTQNPVLNSFLSASVLSDNASSLLVGGRPFRRSCCSCSISGMPLSMYLFVRDLC